MLHYRERGGIWYARGTVRVGQTSVKVPEFSTGCAARREAEAVGGAREAKIREEELSGDSGRKAKLTISDVLDAYLQRPHPIEKYDQDRVALFDKAIGTYGLNKIAEAWTEWLKRRRGLAPSTIARERSILVSAINTGCIALNALPAPKVPSVKQSKEERVVLLTDADRRRLLENYSPAARRPATMLCHQGMRASEALQLSWANVDMQRKTIRVVSTESKNGRARTLPMHPDVYVMLIPLHAAHLAALDVAKVARSNRSVPNNVFLSSRSEPFRDARATRGGTGGNPISGAHDRACRLAGIQDFRVHDWRHDWAARMVIAGVDLITLQKLGGWADLRMVSRYAAFANDEHMQAAMMKIA